MTRYRLHLHTRRKVHYNGKAFRFSPPRAVCNRSLKGKALLTAAIDDVTCGACRAYLVRHPVLRAGQKFFIGNPINIIVPPEDFSSPDTPFDND